MITIIDYGSGNLFAIRNIYHRLNIPFKISSSPEEILDAKKLILPGVGDFDETMNMLVDKGIKEALDIAVLENNIPILGVCVGMQIMGNSSEEGKEKGFGWIDGEIKKINVDDLKSKPHLPHLGWNTIDFKEKDKLFKGIENGSEFYFLHSYYFDCNNKSEEYSITNYGNKFASSINKGNIYGVQFHPEKSHQNGILIFKNFYDL